MTFFGTHRSSPRRRSPLGEGYSYSEEAGQIASITKLTRVALLVPVLVLLPLVFRTASVLSLTVATSVH